MTKSMKSTVLGRWSQQLSQGLASSGPPVMISKTEDAHICTQRRKGPQLWGYHHALIHKQRTSKLGGLTGATRAGWLGMILKMRCPKTGGSLKRKRGRGRLPRFRSLERKIFTSHSKWSMRWLTKRISSRWRKCFSDSMAHSLRESTGPVWTKMYPS
jgi:hypothetical protein